MIYLDVIALVSRSYETITFKDPIPEHALFYLKQKLGDIDLPEKERSLRHAVEILGGRFTDLTLFAAKVRSGVAIDAAVQEILMRAIVEVRRVGLGQEQQRVSVGGDGKSQQLQREWTAVQFWHVLKSLNAQEVVSFEAVRNHPLFKGDDTPLYAMERTELVTIGYSQGIPHHCPMNSMHLQ